MEYLIEPLDAASAAEGDLRAWYELFAATRAADFPDFPAVSFASFAKLRRAPSFLDRGRQRAWAARATDGTLLGVGTLVYLEQEHGDWAVPQLEVSASDRRRGIGAALMRALVADALAEGRTGLVQEQVRVGTAGERWARAVGFTETLRHCWQMLHVQQTQQTSPGLWQVPTPPGYRLEQWTGAAPESLVTAFAVARNAIGDAPRGESAYRAPTWTVERVRQAEADARAAGDEMRYVVAVHEASGEIAALTGLLLAPPRVDLCWQRDTAVVRGHRGLGLGRVVKAAMMRALVAEYPGLGRVVTSTAADNAAMIRVNEQVGYVRSAEIAMFEAEVGQVVRALGGSGVPRPRREVEGVEVEGVRGPDGVRGPETVGRVREAGEPEPLGAP
ncbi:MAG TPA: GNAT family N-acetyltransferase [Actinospica sp.]|nr:GNAT family N-acetyltransferase [Actinospica sp.]